MPCFSISAAKLATYNINRIRPRTESSGQQTISLCHDELIVSDRINTNETNHARYLRFQNFPAGVVTKHHDQPYPAASFSITWKNDLPQKSGGLKNYWQSNCVTFRANPNPKIAVSAVLIPKLTGGQIINL
jgi:hypothetical protein